MKQVHVRLSKAHWRKLSEVVPRAYSYMEWTRLVLLHAADLDVPPPPNTLGSTRCYRRMSIRLDPERAAVVKAWAARHNVTIAEAVRGFISNQ